MRGVAIALIFLSHCEHLLKINDINVLMYWGAAGVSLFIALAGFLVARKCLSSNVSVNAIALYKSRWKQFYKYHFLTMIIAMPFTCGLLISNPIKWVAKMLPNLTLIHAFIPSKVIYFSFNAVSWYLSLMLAFALFTPAAIFVWKKCTLKITIGVIFFIVVFEAGSAALLGSQEIFHWIAYIFPGTRFLDFFAGGGAYMIAKYIKEKGLYKLNWFLFVASCVSFVGLLLLSCFYGNNFFLTAIWTIPSTLIVLSLSNIIVEQSLPITKILVGFGNISFEFFLVHHLTIKYFSILFKSLDAPYTGAYILSFIIVCVVAFMLHNWPLNSRKQAES